MRTEMLLAGLLAAPAAPATAILLTAFASLAAATALATAGPAEPPAPRPDFKALATRVAEETIADRRWLHSHPELSLREFKTQEYLKKKLAAIPGVELVPGDWGTGLVVLLRGSRPGPLVAWRADIDALPLIESTGLPYASTVRDTMRGRDVGVMHACGHDIHAAVLLGAARVLAQSRTTLPGSVLFVIEPAEEIGAGAPLLLEAGLFAGERKPESIFGIHDHPTIPYGKVSYCPGRSSGNVDEFRVRVVGKGGHGAYPHEAKDPVVIAAQMVVALQSIVSREVNSARQAVITVGSIHGGTTSNVIPESVELAGTVRTLEPEIRSQVQAAVERTIRGIAAAAGAPEPEITYSLGTPSMNNDPTLVAETLPTLERVVGTANVVRYEPGMGGEDFSFYQDVVPGFLFRLGVGRPEREMALHNPDFDPDERAIPLGVEVASAVLWDRLTLVADRGTAPARGPQSPAPPALAPQPPAPPAP
jgi:amidohydrolase